jgi:ribulose-phosphate 3-epimerase
MDRRFSVSPSVICADWKDLSLLSRLSVLGIRCLHVDIIDGKFSPSMPLDMNDVPSIAGRAASAGLGLDFHIMALDNEKYIRQSLEFNPCQICFHAETSLHIDRLLRIIRSAGVRCGIALNPATPVGVLGCAAEVCDFVLLMLINPGYADDGDEVMVPYALKKIQECRALLDRTGRNIDIELDGRVSFANAAELVKAGANILVAGSSSLFLRNAPLEDNYKRFMEAVNAS